MKRLRILSAIIFLATFAAALEALAQPGGMMWRGSGGWGPGSPYNRMYDPKSLETVSGEVVNVDRIIPNKGMSNGVHLTLKTDKETLSVHLGPASRDGLTGIVAQKWSFPEPLPAPPWEYAFAHQRESNQIPGPRQSGDICAWS